MLEAVTPRSRPANMPVDYTAYLLSSSPPGTGLEFLRTTCAVDRSFHANGFNHFSRFGQSKNKTNRLHPVKPIIVTCDRNNNADTDSTTTDCPLLPAVPTSPGGKSKKKVSFADHKGQALAMVRIMTEPSDVPPRLRPEILSALTLGASAGVTELPPLKLNFSQPASDYVAFRDRLERNCVSLENVILKDYSMMGTVKVKNLSYEKNVFLRVTFDSWETNEDIACTYAVNSTEAQGRMYDTFTFEVNVPPNFNPKKNMMFAVCYEAEGSQYWDSNEGQNYCVVSANFPSTTEPPLGEPSDPQIKTVDSWTEFAAWNHVDTSLPYW